ncbi:MAG TPA: hypothetical protein PKX84_06855, partial [Bacteroidia bacterium]|nr:hypothetical protein [Bacteroidia bacterium]
MDDFGFCLFILTSLHLSDAARNAMVDEITSGVAFLLVISSFLSFLSIKSDKEKKAEKAPKEKTEKAEKAEKAPENIGEKKKKKGGTDTETRK